MCSFFFKLSCNSLKRVGVLMVSKFAEFQPQLYIRIFLKVPNYLRLLQYDPTKKYISRGHY